MKIQCQAARLMKAFDLETVQSLTSPEEMKQKEVEEKRNCAQCKKPNAKNRQIQLENFELGMVGLE